MIWLQQNRAALERGFAETAPSWAKLAAYLGDHGVLDGDGKRPTAEATRQAWYRTKGIAPAKERWSPFFGQVVKLGLPDEKDGSDDGQAEAVWG